MRLYLPLSDITLISVLHTLACLHYDGKKITAVKLYVNLFGVGIVAAKEALEEISGSYSACVRHAERLINRNPNLSTEG